MSTVISRMSDVEYSISDVERQMSNISDVGYEKWDVKSKDMP